MEIKTGKIACTALAICIGTTLCAAPLASATNTENTTDSASTTEVSTTKATTKLKSEIKLSDNPCEVTEHSFNGTKVSLPSCLKAGYISVTCETCGTVIYTTIPALEHLEQDCGNKAATCTEAGTTGGKACIRCGEVTSQPTEEKALGHSYEKVTKAATCTKVGYTAMKCTRCGLLADKTELAATGHKWASTWKKNKTYHWKACTNSGCSSKKSKAKHTYKNGKCKICGYKK